MVQVKNGVTCNRNLRSKSLVLLLSLEEGSLSIDSGIFLAKCGAQQGRLQISDTSFSCFSRKAG